MYFASRGEQFNDRRYEAFSYLSVVAFAMWMRMSRQSEGEMKSNENAFEWWTKPEALKSKVCPNSRERWKFLDFLSNWFRSNMQSNCFVRTIHLESVCLSSILRKKKYKLYGEHQTPDFPFDICLRRWQQRWQCAPTLLCLSGQSHSFQAMTDCVAVNNKDSCMRANVPNATLRSTTNCKIAKPTCIATLI